ncbi:FG-GAP-like repeat-containing protein [Rubripirellula tenax]|nr:FG-GAP-like repeat-containing protein [Rubripirellula tenax]
MGCRSESENIPSETVSSPVATDHPPAPSKQQRLDAAGRHLKSGEFERADDVIRALLIEDPDDQQASALMLRILLHRNDVASAIELLDRMGSQNPERRDDFDAHAASLLFQRKDFDAAITRLERLLGRSPDFDEARHLLAKVLDEQGDTFSSNQQARQLLNHTMLNRDELIGLIFPTRTHLTEQDISDSDAMRLKHRPSVLSVASTHRILGNPREALASLDASSDFTSRRNPAGIALYGRSLADAQMMDRLALWVAEAPAECESYPDFWMACGALARLNDPAVATECFVKAIRIEPGSIDAHYGLIQALEECGRHALAEKFRTRSNAVDSLARDVKRIRESTKPDPQDFVDVATQLMNVGRPLEAIAWQEYAIANFAPNSEERRSIPTYKTKVLERFPTGRDEETLLDELAESECSQAIAWLAASRSNPVNPSTMNAIDDRRPVPSGIDDLPFCDPVFVDVADRMKLSFQYFNAASPVDREFQIFQAFGGGAACIDFDRDGAVDFYLAQAGTTPPNGISAFANGLFRNQGKHFVDVIESSSADDRAYSVGVSAGDWNQDGFADLFIGNLGRNRLLINQGDGTFSDSQDPAIGQEQAYTSSVAIADLNDDGLPDIVEINYLDDPRIFAPIERDLEGKPVSLPGPLQFQPAMDRMILSVGDGTMDARPLGDQASDQFSTGLALIVTDIDGNRGNEVFVANDLRANQLWVRDDKTSEWNDAAVGVGVAYGTQGKPMACMGIAAADFDRNGQLDLHISNFENEWSNQYMQTKSGTFVDSAVPFRLDALSRKMLGFGTQAIDFDNNTIWDLIVGNGHIEDLTDKGSLFAMPTQLLAGSSDGFVETHVAGDDTYWQGMHFSRAMAKCDFNRDGKIDLLVTDLKSKPSLLENQTPTSHHGLQLELVGTRSERDAIGAIVVVEFGSTELMQTVQTGDGYLSKNESALFFGLGDTKSIDRVRVRWPSGIEQVFTDLDVDSRWQLVENAPTPWQLNVGVSPRK